MERGSIHIFVLDDVHYGLGECVNFAPILEPLGFSARESCPACHSDDVIVPYPAKVSGKETVECLELTEEDFVKSPQGEWQLSDAAVNQLQNDLGSGA
jgi:hypothetical protein